MVARLRIILVCREIQFVVRRVVPRFAKWEVSHLRRHAAAGIGHHAIRQMILMIIIRARGIDPGQQRSTRVNVLACGRAWRCAVHVLSNHLRAREDIHRCRTARDLLHPQAVPVVSVCPGAQPSARCDRTAFAIVGNRVQLSLVMLPLRS